MGTATYVKICCPRCGEKDLNIIGDRDIGGAVASGMGVSVFAGTKAGVLAGASGLQQKTYWICKKCGRKFVTFTGNMDFCSRCLLVGE